MNTTPKPSLRFRPLRPAVAGDTTGRLDLLISVVPPPAPAAATPRPPLNLALVIDRSGSMDGEPLSQARKAARFLARELTPADHLAIVAFDHEAELLVPSQPVLDPAPFIAAINGIHARGLTDLHQGWFNGALQVAQQLNPQAMNRVLLLSDGHSNQGVTDAEPIAEQVAGLTQRGISTSAFGLGDGFDEDLMGAIASSGDGTLAFIDDPKQLPDLYANELNGLTHTAAKRVSLGIHPRNGAELIDVLNDLPQTAYGNWQLPNLHHGPGNDLHVAVRLQLPAWSANAEIASVRLAWEQPGETDRHSQVTTLQLPVMAAAELAEMAEDPLVAEQFALLQANRDRQRAIDALDANDLEGAEHRLIAIDAALASLPNSEAIAAERQALDEHRALLHSNRNRGRKQLRRDALRSSVNVWDQPTNTGRRH